MARGVPVDRDELWHTIWNERDRLGRVTIHQKRFAEHVGVSESHMCRLIKEFEADGVLKKVGARYRNVGVYVVKNPDPESGIGPGNMPL